MYNYFVSYFYQDKKFKNIIGMGNGIATRNKEIKNYNDILEVEEAIIKKDNIDGIVKINNFQLLTIKKNEEE